MKKHIVLTTLFDSGGSNAHFKNLVNYLGKDNIILILEDENQICHLNDIVKEPLFKTLIINDLHGYAHLKYFFSTNLKELFFIVRSILLLILTSLKNGFADITVSAVEPEKHLYLLWVPLLKVKYILHTEPQHAFTPFTTITCNLNLGKRKRLITVSKAMKEAIKNNWKVKDDKDAFINIISNCITEKDFIKKPSQTLQSSKIIITLGHVDQRKNPSLWCKVAKRISDLRPGTEFIWLGNGPLLDYFKSETVQNDTIHFLGLTDNRQDYLEKASIYYQPSLNEPQGIAVLEAMYNGLPCVAANIGGLPESVHHQFNGLLVDPTNVEENVKALILLLDNEELRLEFGANSYKRYTDLFTNYAFKIKMDAVYK